jgi:excisionase family DNA binding protein
VPLDFAAPKKTSVFDSPVLRELIERIRDTPLNLSIVGRGFRWMGQVADAPATVLSRPVTAALTTGSPKRRSPKKPKNAPPQPPVLEQRYLSTAEAALYTGISESTLEKWRIDGKGPEYTKAGKMVLYDVRDLDAFMAARKRRSTSDPGAGSA